MISRRRARTMRRQFMALLSMGSLFAAPLGCIGQGSLLPDGLSPDDFNPAGSGLFVNPNVADSLLLAARGAAGDSFFAYGKRSASGAFERLDSVVLNTAAGETSQVLFENGWPVEISGPDGSQVALTYSSAGSLQLSVNVDARDAVGAPLYQDTLSVDLQQPAREVAELVERVTGRPLEFLSEDDARVAVSAAGEPKSLAAQVSVTIFSPLFTLLVLPFVAVIYAATVILGQVLAILYAAVVVVLQTVLIILFSPLFLLSAILTDSVVNIRLVPLDDIFESVPPPPFLT